MAAGMLILIRLATRFSNKILMLTGFFMMLLMHLVCATTSSPGLTIAATVILGFSKILTLGELYLAWLAIWSKKLDSARLYPFLYFVAIAGLYFLSWFTAWVTKLYSWRYAYQAVIILFAICIILALIFVQNSKLKKKIPLYQLDIPALLLFIITLMSVNYIAVYGKVEDWFNSAAIRIASFVTVITALLFIKREMTVKRPLLNLSVFKSKQFTTGLLLLILMGVFIPSTFQNSYTGSVLHFESIRNSEINLFHIPGILVGSVLAYFWYKNNYSGHLLILIGFAAVVGYHILMYGQFVNDLNIHAFLVPAILKGVGQVILYISIALYATAGFQFPFILKPVGLLLVTRSFLGPGIFSGLYNYFLYAGRTKHLSGLAGSIDANEPLVFQYTDVPGFYRNIQQQASLTALKELSGNIIITGLLLVTILMAVFIYRALKKKFTVNTR